MNRARMTATLTTLLLLGSLTPTTLHAEPRPVRIGMVLDGPGEFLQRFANDVRQEIGELLAGEFDARFPDRAQRTADWTFTGIRQAFEALLADPEVDLVIAIGGVASAVACVRTALPKPVLATMVMSQTPGIPRDKERSGRDNLNYLAHPWLMKSDIKIFREIYPFRRLAFVVSEYVLEAEHQPTAEAPTPADLRPILGDYVLVPVGASAAEALAAIPDDVDAVYVGHTFQLSAAELDAFVAGLIARKLPSFSMMGRQDVERGMLAGQRSAEDTARMSRQVAINVQRIVLGEDAGQIPVVFTTGTRLVINARTARAIGVSPPYRVLLEAEMLHEGDIAGARTLTYRQVIDEALRANLDLAVAHLETIAGAEDQRVARANLLPSLDLGTQATVIDKDRAEASMGAQPEFGWTASLTLQQVLAEGAFASLTIEEHLQQGRVFKEREIKLDIVEAALVAYLNVLSARVGERIRRTNMRVSRANHDLAQKRVLIGASTAAELYRWESVIAQQRQEVVEANRQCSLAEMELNRVLRRPLEEAFDLAPIELTAELFGFEQDELAALLDNPRSMKHFRDFLAKTCFELSPELAQLRESVAVIERSRDSVSRSFWLPALALQGQVGQRILDAGAGTGSPALPPEAAALAGLFPEQDDTTWSVALSLAWPLLEGGRRLAQLDQLDTQRAQLAAQIDGVKQRLEQRMRGAMRNVHASGTSILLAKVAAEAAHKSLDMVTDAYSRGALSIVDLLDAQNAALQSDLASAYAEFAYMTDLIHAQRAAGDFYVLHGRARVRQWTDEFREYLEAHDAQPAGR